MLLLTKLFYLSFLSLFLFADYVVQLQTKLLHLLLFSMFVYHVPEVCYLMNKLGGVPCFEIIVAAGWLFPLVQNLFGSFP